MDGKVLMIQEAKLSCRGQWYLPAGRMEKNESIVVCTPCAYYVCMCVRKEAAATAHNFVCRPQ